MFSKLLVFFVVTCLLMVQIPASQAQSGDGLDSQRQLGMDHLKKRNYPEAAKVFSSIVESAPLSAPDHFVYGEILLLQDKNPEAALELRQAYNIKPSESIYGLKCAEALVAAGKPTEAIAVLDAAIAQCKDPEYKASLESLKKSILQPYKKPPVVNPEQPTKKENVR